MNSKKIVKFNKNNELVEVTAEHEAVMVLKRGTMTEDAINNVSDYLRSLSLSAEENNRMIDLMKVMLLAAEQEQYLQGFSDGCSLIHEENNKK